MNKKGLIEEKKITIKMTNENGLAIRKDDISLSTGKIVINGVEITDTESWHKALETFNNLLKQLEAYENMRKEAKNFIQENKNKTIVTYGDDYDYEVCLFEEDIKDLLNILNKVGGSDE